MQSMHSIGLGVHAVPITYIRRAKDCWTYTRVHTLALDIQGMDPSTLHLRNLPSLTHVLRTLKRQENSLFNCVASCISDADFVIQIARLYAGLPTYANLR
jgi:hypothetical protein